MAIRPKNVLKSFCLVNGRITYWTSESKDEFVKQRREELRQGMDYVLAKHDHVSSSTDSKMDLTPDVAVQEPSKMEMETKDQQKEADTPTKVVESVGDCGDVKKDDEKRSLEEVSGEVETGSGDDANNNETINGVPPVNGTVEEGETSSDLVESEKQSDVVEKDLDVEGKTEPVYTAVSDETEPVSTAVSDETKPVSTAVSDETKPVSTAVSDETKPVSTAVSDETKPVSTAVSDETKPVSTAVSGKFCNGAAENLLMKDADDDYEAKERRYLWGIKNSMPPKKRRFVEQIEQTEEPVAGPSRSIESTSYCGGPLHIVCDDDDDTDSENDAEDEAGSTTDEADETSEQQGVVEGPVEAEVPSPPKKKRSVWWCSLGCDDVFPTLRALKDHVKDFHGRDPSRINKFNYVLWHMPVAQTGYFRPDTESESEDVDQ